MDQQVSTNEAYFSVSTIKTKPGKAKEVRSLYAYPTVLSISLTFVMQVHDALSEVAQATLRNEPGAKIYRFFKSEDKDEFVCIEKSVHSFPRLAYALDHRLT